MKERTMNELRQTKEYYIPKKQRKVPRYPKSYEVQHEDQEAHKTPEEIKEITLKQQMQEIADIVAPTINDVIFNEIIEVMDNYDELNWGYFVQDDAPTALLDACFEHKQKIHYKIFQLVLKEL